MSITTNQKFTDAVRAVSAELRSLSQKEFARELKRHEDGDLARMLMGTDALCLSAAIEEGKDGS